MQFTETALYRGWQKGAWSDRTSSRPLKHDYGVYGYILSGPTLDAAYRTCSIDGWRTVVLLSSKATAKKGKKYALHLTSYLYLFYRVSTLADALQCCHTAFNFDYLHHHAIHTWVSRCQPRMQFPMTLASERVLVLFKSPLANGATRD